MRRRGVLEREERPATAGLGDVRVAVVGQIEAMTYNVVASLGLAGVEAEVWAPGACSRLRASRFVARFHEVPDRLFRPMGEALAEMLAPAFAEREISIAVPADYDGFAWLADHAVDLTPTRAFPMPSRELIEFYNDKWRMATACARAGIDTPLTCLLERPADLDGLDRLRGRGPIVVKPLTAGDSFGVYVLDSTDELAAHLVSDDRPGNELPLIVQEHVPGRDLDVTVVANVGRVTDAVVSEHVAGSRTLRYFDHPRAVEVAGRIAAIGCYHGVLDFDFREDPATGRLVVVDTNPRLTGSTLVKTWAGANLPVQGVRMAMGLAHEPRSGTAAGFHRPVGPELVAAIGRGWWRADNAPTRAALRCAISDLGYHRARQATPV